MTRCFVTGGAGFIGSHLVDRLVADKHEVTVYDNLSSGKLEFIDHHLKRNRIKFIHADLLEREKLIEAITGHELVFHFAANPDVRIGATDPMIDIQNGFIATYNLLEAMRINNIRKIVFASSSVVYGEATEMPTPEHYGPLIPISIYGASKLGAEGLITAYAHTFDFQIWIFRFANVIGSRATHGVIIDFIHKLQKNKYELEILGDGKQKKSYMLVEDCVDAMLYVLNHTATNAINIYNLGYEDQINVTEIAKIVVEQLGLKNVKFRFTGGSRGWRGDVPEMLLAIDKLKALGWKPKYNSEQAVRRAVKLLIDDELKKLQSLKF